jgi:dTDP-4-amino-4,6-dideoxygalactose transaminase
MALGIKHEDEVIVADRTWIATAHAISLLGAQVVPVDVESNRPVINVAKIESLINERTKAIIPVHMNGRSADMRAISFIAEKYKLKVIEDAAQALGSKNINGFLGTQSDIGCFSLSVAKTISTGQGGFCVTNDAVLASRMRAIRTHGVENVKDPTEWKMMGFNFRFTDVLAAIGLQQLQKIEIRIAYLKKIYQKYERELLNSDFTIIPVDLRSGEVPIYSEFLVRDRGRWVDKLSNHGIETRCFYPSIHSAPYLKTRNFDYLNSTLFAESGIYLPSGPAQTLESIAYCIERIKG